MKLIRVVDLADNASAQTELGNSSINSISIHEEVEEELHQSRHSTRLTLFIVFLLGLANGLNVFMLSSTVCQNDAHFDMIWKNERILTSISFIFYVVFGILIKSNVENSGFRIHLLAACVLHLLGDLSIYIAFTLHAPKRAFATAVLGQLFTAAGFTLSLELPTKAEMFCREKEQAIKNTLLLASLFFGIGVKYGIFAANITEHTMAELFKIVILCKISVVSITLVISFLVFYKATRQDHFSSEPSTDSSRPLNTRRYLCANINSILATQGYAIYFALVPPSFIVLQKTFADELERGKSDSLQLWLESGAAMSAFIGILFGFILLRCNSKLKLVGTFAILLSWVNILIFTFSLTGVKSLNVSMVFLLAWAGTATSWLATGITYVTSITNASLAGIKQTECLTIGCLYATILIYLDQWIMKVYGFIFVGYFHAALYLFSLLLVVTSRPIKDDTEHEVIFNQG